MCLQKIIFVHLAHKTQQMPQLRVLNVTLTYSCSVFVFPLVEILYSLGHFESSGGFWVYTLWSDTDSSNILTGSGPPIKNRFRHSIFLHIIVSFITQNWTSKFLHTTEWTIHAPTLWDYDYAPKCVLLSTQNYYKSVRLLLSVTVFPNMFYSLPCEIKATVSFR